MGWGEISLHYNEVPPASRGGSAGDSADVSEDLLNLLPSTTRDLRLNSLNGGVVQLPSPPPCDEGGLVGYGEKALEVAAQLLHRSRGEATNGYSEVQAARSPCTRSTGAVADHVGLVPVPTTNGAGNYQGFGRVGGDPGFRYASGGPRSCEGPVPVDGAGASGGTRLRARPTVGNRAKSAERRVLDGDGPGDTDKPVPDGGSASIEGCLVEGCRQIESIARNSEG